MDEKVITETSGHKSSKALSSYGHTVSKILNKMWNTCTDSTGTSSKDTKSLLSEALDEEQTTETECKTSAKEQKITDNGDNSTQDIFKPGTRRPHLVS